MSHPYFDSDEYPRRGYGWCDEADQRREVEGYAARGHTPPWVLAEMRRFGIQPRQGELPLEGGQ